MKATEVALAPRSRPEADGLPTVEELLADIDSAGIQLRVEDGVLSVAAPLAALTDERVVGIQKRQREVIDTIEKLAARAALVVRPTFDDGTTPLAVPQERLWFLQQLSPQSVAYNIAIALKVVGRIDADSVVAAVQALVERHSALRTAFPVVEGRPLQRILAASPCITDVVTLLSQPHDSPVDEAMRLATELADRPFDVAAGPVVRARLIRIAPSESLLVFVVHHLACDQWSMGLLGREFAELYDAHLTGRPHLLPALPVQYRDYAVCHRSWLGGGLLRNQLAYWQRQLGDLMPAVLPSSASALPGVMPGAAGVIELGPVLLARLKLVGAEGRSTLFMVLLSAFYVVLSRYTGRTDLTVGVPVANRTSKIAETLVGTLVNTLVLRTDLAGSLTFADLLADVRATSLDAFANSDVSFDRLVSELRPDRLAGRTPFFQALFNVQNAPFPLPSLTGARTELIPLPLPATQFDIAVSIDTEIAFRLSYTYDTGLFDREFIVQFFRHYLNVLRSVAENPRQKIDDLSLFDQAELRAIAETWQGDAIPAWSDRTVLSLFAAQAGAGGHKPALVVGDSTLTYAELDARSSQLATSLRAVGVAPETIVGVYLDRSVDVVVALLGILKAGGAYLPLDPAFPAERLAFMVEDSRAKVVVTHSQLLDRLPGTAPGICLDIEDRVAPSVVATAPIAPHQLAYVLYTSGSTGRPKAVAIEHRALANFLLSMQREPGLNEGDRLLSVTTLSFDIAALEIFLPLVTGAVVVMATQPDVADPAALARLLAQHRITVMQATPATWRMLLEAGWEGRKDLKVLCGGEALTRDLADRLLERAGELWNLYGPTETTVWSTIEKIEPGTSGISIGRPIANTDVFIVDHQLRPVPTGAVGELVIGGVGVARGYLNRPELTAEKFPAAALSRRPGARWYRTGDLARRRRDGRLECLGRSDQQVKIRGYRVEVGEVEGALEGLPGVAGAAAKAVPDASGESQLIAFVVWAPSAAPRSSSEVRSALGFKLPAYMVPSRVVALDRFPLTPNGKVNRSRLEVPASLVETTSSSAAPLTDVQRSVARIWAEAFGVRSVSIDDDFFAIGGHSLLAVQVMAKIQEEFDRSLALATFFEARTVRALARVLDGEQPPSPWVSLVPIKPHGQRPPFFCVHAVGGEVLIYSALAERLSPDQPLVGIRAPSFDGRGAALETIEEQAESYLREVLAFQPNGPYFIGGYSHGGRVALELALRLTNRGKKVALLAILDTPPSYEPQPMFRYGIRWLANFPKWFWHDFRLAPAGRNLDRLFRFARRVRRYLGLATGGSKTVGTSTSDIREVMNIDALPAEIQQVYQQDFQAFLAYQPSGRCGDVTVFRATAQPVFGCHEPDLGWGRVSSGTVTVCSVVGNHSSILEPPVVERLATALQDALDRAYAAETSLALL